MRISSDDKFLMNLALKAKLEADRREMTMAMEVEKFNESKRITDNHNRKVLKALGVDPEDEFSSDDSGFSDEFDGFSR